ncbi:dihydrolipoamide acetyltransferase family protein [Fredinandcohnia onubensis]|uniref:dihydrolipoamide acetyltransferase family protein n=1 Tax=Fredinandcohnia onubensis TaxID=1571209 RepID=UPI000C0BF096|nr:dihydrolipoamide acetyltransferase family protein [Fredinandcohnia onubensis]
MEKNLEEIMNAEAIKLRGMRRTIARRMQESLSKSAQLTLHSTIVIRELVEFKASNKEVSYNDIFIKAVALALSSHKRLNSTLVDNTIYQWPDINIGIAVALDDGLLVPVIQKVQEKSLSQIKQDRIDLIQRGKTGQLTAEEVTAGTFTISNLGMYPIDCFTPILNSPQVALLGIGRIKQETVVINQQIEIAPVLNLSLTIDHQVIDGAPGAAFLKELENILHHPELIN